jgi:pilus assembly protein Flp/PilA
MRVLLARVVTDARGVTAMEYGLLAGLIALVIIGILTTLGTNLQNMFSLIATSL